MNQIYTELIKILPPLISFFAILIIGYLVICLLIKFIKKLLSRTKLDGVVVSFTLSLTRGILYCIVAISALATVGVNVSSLITAIGAAAITAGLALKDSLGNLVSGIILLLTKPFQAGDVLEIDGVKGNVASIKIFFTTVHTYDKKTITVPNSILTSNKVINCTKNELRRVDLKYTVSYEDDLAKVKNVIFDVTKGFEKIVSEPSPEVHIGEHLDSGVQIIVFVWTNPDDYFDAYYYMQENVKLAFDKNNITIPYPHLVVRDK